MHASIILPSFNERGNIIPLISKIIKCLKNFEFEVIVVDDNSLDRTADAYRNKFKSNKNVKVYVRAKERGLATAIKFGIEKASGKYIVVMDTDLNHDPKIIPLMLEEINRFSMVIGSRYIKGGGMENRKRYWLSRFYNIYLRLFLGIPVTDFLSGFFCMKKNYLMHVLKNTNDIFLGYGEYFMKLLFAVHKEGGRIFETPVFYINRPYGKSKSNFLKMFLTYTKTSIELLTGNK